MILAIIIATILLLVLSVLFLPNIKIGKLTIGTYWVVSLIGAIFLLIFARFDLSILLRSFFSANIGPVPILVLFISMTILSIFLDEIGFFKYIASVITRKALGSQLKVFIALYVLTSILTVFTSNDIIILTFTPFICYFSKRAKVSAIPYLVSEFIAANTWSMMLIIGNPTNIFTATSSGILFLDYFLKMFIPTLGTGLLSFLILLLVFRKSLKEPLQGDMTIEDKPNKVMLIIGLLHLGLCTIMLIISGYVNIPMWIIAFGFMICELVVLSIYYIIRKEKPILLGKTLKRAPWTLIPFLLSMFTIVYGAKEFGYITKLAEWLNKLNSPYLLGLASLLSCNLINNIPMSVMYSEILATGLFNYNAVYIVIAASNLGAFLTPIGALAGVMWMSILKKQNIEYRFIDFIKYGVIVAVPSILFAVLLITLI